MRTFFIVQALVLAACLGERKPTKEAEPPLVAFDETGWRVRLRTALDTPPFAATNPDVFLVATKTEQDAYTDWLNRVQDLMVEPVNAARANTRACARHAVPSNAFCDPVRAVRLVQGYFPALNRLVPGMLDAFIVRQFDVDPDLYNEMMHARIVLGDIEGANRLKYFLGLWREAKAQAGMR